jgi:hypothetical protein
MEAQYLQCYCATFLKFDFSRKLGEVRYSRDLAVISLTINNNFKNAFCSVCSSTAQRDPEHLDPSARLPGLCRHPFLGLPLLPQQDHVGGEENFSKFSFAISGAEYLPSWKPVRGIRISDDLRIIDIIFKEILITYGTEFGVPVINEKFYFLNGYLYRFTLPIYEVLLLKKRGAPTLVKRVLKG